MFKMKWPYSILVLLFFIIIQVPIWIGSLSASLVDVIGLSVIIYKLQSADHFDSRSFYGKILSQFTLGEVVSLKEMIAHVGARLVAFLMLTLEWGCIWWVGLATSIILLTMTHWIEN